MKRRVFLAGLATQVFPREITRNRIWRELVPLVKDSSLRLTALQDYIVAHQKETTLATVDRVFLSNLECCIDDLQELAHRLKALKEVLKNGG